MSRPKPVNLKALHQRKKPTGKFISDNSLFIFGCLFFSGVIFAVLTQQNSVLILLSFAAIATAVYFINWLPKDDFVLKVLADFCVDNNFELLVSNNDLAPVGSIIQAGSGKHRSRYGFSGKIKGNNFKIFWHTFESGRGRYQTTYSYGIVEISLEKNLPHIFIDNRKNDSQLNPEILDTFHDKQLVELEGDFPSKFRVFSVEGNQIELLTLLNPAFMHSLMEYRDDFEVEFIDEFAVGYLRHSYLPSEVSVVKLLEFGDFLSTNLNKQLDTFNSSGRK